MSDSGLPRRASSVPSTATTGSSPASGAVMWAISAVLATGQNRRWCPPTGVQHHGRLNLELVDSPGMTDLGESRDAAGRRGSKSKLLLKPCLQTRVGSSVCMQARRPREDRRLWRMASQCLPGSRPR